MSPLRRIFLLSLAVGLLCVAGGCDDSALPRFARPPPVDAGRDAATDASADAATAPDAD